MLWYCDGTTQSGSGAGSKDNSRMYIYDIEYIICCVLASTQTQWNRIGYLQNAKRTQD